MRKKENVEGTDGLQSAATMVGRRVTIQLV